MVYTLNIWYTSWKRTMYNTFTSLKRTIYNIFTSLKRMVYNIHFISISNIHWIFTSWKRRTKRRNTIPGSWSFHPTFAKKTFSENKLLLWVCGQSLKNNFFPRICLLLKTQILLSACQAWVVVRAWKPILPPLTFRNF